MEKKIQDGKKRIPRETALGNQREGATQPLTGDDTCEGSPGSQVSSSSEFMEIW